MSLKDFAYTNTPIDFQLLIDGVDVSESVADIPSISKSIDYPRITAYRVGEMTVLLNDADGYYSETRADNFFVGQGKRQSGIGVSVELKVGYEGDALERFFIGEIIKIDQEVDDDTAQTQLVVSDEFNKLFTTDIKDFGLEKAFKLLEDTTDEQQLNGRYPLPDFVLPASEGATVVSKGLNDTLTEVSELATRGAVTQGIFSITEDAIETEGGYIQNPATGYPQVRLKSPYRHVPVKAVVEKILTKIGISNSVVEIPTETTAHHFSSLGRIGYAIVAQSIFGTSNPADWQGYVTDAMFESGVFYFLYTSQRGDLKNRSVLFSYTRSTDTWTLLWRAGVVAHATTEIWKMAKNGNDMAILATDAGITMRRETEFKDILPIQTGSYNAAESGNSVYILKRDLSLAYTDTTVVQLVHKNAPIKAQLAHRYLLGSTYSDFRSVDAGSSIPVQRPPEMLPDSRRKILWHNNELYYCGVSATHVGVAKISRAGGTPTWVETIQRDRQGNEAGLHMDIKGSKLFIVANFKNQKKSKALAWSKAL